MSDAQDKRERQKILELYAPRMSRCEGGRIVRAGYVCHWCGSDDPASKCEKPRKKSVRFKTQEGEE